MSDPMTKDNGGEVTMVNTTRASDKQRYAGPSVAWPPVIQGHGEKKVCISIQGVQNVRCLSIFFKLLSRFSTIKFTIGDISLPLHSSSTIITNTVDYSLLSLISATLNVNKLWEADIFKRIALFQSGFQQCGISLHLRFLDFLHRTSPQNEKKYGDQNVSNYIEDVNLECKI